MKLSDAKDLVKAMHAAHGKTPADDVIAELAIEVANAACGQCARATIEHGRTEAKWPLSVPAFFAGYRTRFAHPDHAEHIDVDDHATQVGKDEAFWRTTAPAILMERLPNEAAARWVAARMWFSESVEATQWAVRDELTYPRPIWLELPPPTDDLEGAIHALLEDAREVALFGYDAWFARKGVRAGRQGSLDAPG